MASSSRSPRSSKPPPLASGDWAVQVGAFRNENSAAAQLFVAQNLGLEPLTTASAIVVAKGDNLYRARFTGLSETEARAACDAMKRGGRGCAMVSPSQG